MLEGIQLASQAYRIKREGDSMDQVTSRRASWFEASLMRGINRYSTTSWIREVSHPRVAPCLSIPGTPITSPTAVPRIAWHHPSCHQMTLLSPARPNQESSDRQLSHRPLSWPLPPSLSPSLAAMKTAAPSISTVETTENSSASRVCVVHPWPRNTRRISARRAIKRRRSNRKRALRCRIITNQWIRTIIVWTSGSISTSWVVVRRDPQVHHFRWARLTRTHRSAIGVSIRNFTRWSKEEVQGT